MIVRTIEKNKELYINAQDLISKIRDHEEKVGTDGVFGDVYKLAHEHIIEVIEVYIGRRL